jgi:hypothetical protein
VTKEIKKGGKEITKGGKKIGMAVRSGAFWNLAPPFPGHDPVVLAASTSVALRVVLDKCSEPHYHKQCDDEAK